MQNIAGSTLGQKNERYMTIIGNWRTCIVRVLKQGMRRPVHNFNLRRLSIFFSPVYFLPGEVLRLSCGQTVQSSYVVLRIISNKCHIGAAVTRRSLLLHIQQKPTDSRLQMEDRCQEMPGRRAAGSTPYPRCQGRLPSRVCFRLDFIVLFRGVYCSLCLFHL